MKKIRDIEPICLTGNDIISETQFKEFIEEPCIEACKDLYYKNIITVQSSANKDDIGHYAWITIDKRTLEDKNVEIFNNLLDRKEKNVLVINNKQNILENYNNLIKISVPIDENDSVDLISKSFLAITNNFDKQDILCGRISFEEFANELFYELYELNTIPYFKNINQLEKILKSYEILSYYNFSDDELSYSLEHALKLYEQIDPENGKDFVNNILKIAESLVDFDCVYDKDEDCFWRNLSYYERHKNYLEDKNVK